MYPDDDCQYCPICGDVRMVEVPICADSPGTDTPERACAECGAALLVDPVTPTRTRRSAVTAA